MQLITLELTNNITFQIFTFQVQVNNWTQFYSRLSVLMSNLAVIEGVAPQNITHIITHNESLAA